jgi:hypothetical protein
LHGTRGLKRGSGRRDAILPWHRVGGGGRGGPAQHGPSPGPSVAMEFVLRRAGVFARGGPERAPADSPACSSTTLKLSHGLITALP